MEDIKRYFKEGDEVAHKENIQHKMEVRRIIRVKKDDKNYTIGIECGWWSDDKYVTEKFHTRKLVPWSIAEKGYVAVINYINAINKVCA